MAQLGARFHGMEEVVSSNLTRSTNPYQPLSACTPVSLDHFGITSVLILHQASEHAIHLFPLSRRIIKRVQQGHVERRMASRLHGFDGLRAAQGLPQRYVSRRKACQPKPL